MAAAAVLSAGSALAHSEHDKARFVAPGGVDQGRCDSAARPCATIAYAALNAGKGDRILVAGGTYPIEDPADLFHVQSGLLDVRLGYSRYDHYMKADTEANAVILTGVPPEFREGLTRRGFHVIADRKQLRGERLEQTRAMLKAVDSMRIAKSSEPCSGGTAGGLACESVDLLAHLPLGDFSQRPATANDIWGFVDLNTDREYVLIGLNNGVAVVDVTEPTAPVEVGNVRGDNTTWRDIKVLQRYDSAAGRYRAYAYVTADGTGDQLQVIDLNGLPNTVTLAASSPAIRFAHNVYMSDADFVSGLAVGGGEPALHIAGSNLGGGAVRSFRLDDPLDPSLAATGTRGYTHDAASLTVDDARAAAQCGTAGPCRVLADFNESTIELWDVTALDAPGLLSSTAYANSAYTHSGWASEDGLHLFVHDELDEQQRGINTTLRVFSLADLGQPLEVGSYVGPSHEAVVIGCARRP
ncbi:MAG: choice-of-anchor B family protein, partial [Pseudomonadota bacterium]